MEENNLVDKSGQIVKSGSQEMEAAKSSFSSRALELIRSIDNSEISSVNPSSTAIDQTNTDNSSLVHQPDEAHLTLGVDKRYSQLRHFLLNKQWLNADDETKKIIIEICGRQEQDWLRVKDLTKLTCKDLQTIDRLWMKYSSNRFGISIQRKIFETFWDGSQNIDYHSKWCKFGELIGWRNEKAWGKATEDMDGWFSVTARAGSPGEEPSAEELSTEELSTEELSTEDELPHESQESEDFPVGFFPRICRLRVGGIVWWAGAPRFPWGSLYCSLMLRFQQCDSLQS